MFCGQCGSVMEPGAQFCEECGAQIDNKALPGVSLFRRTHLLAVISLAVVLGIGSLLFFISSPSRITERESPAAKGREDLKTAVARSSDIDLNKSPETARRELGQLGIQYSEGAFIESAKNNDALAVGLFLAAGMNPNATALTEAAGEGHTAIVQTLLTKGVNVNAKTYAGVTALMAAAARGHTDPVQILLSKGADLEAKDYTGTTALMKAAQGGHAAIVQILLDKGADVKATDLIGHSALEYARDTEIASLLRGVGTGGTKTLMAAAAEGNTAYVQILLDKGADVNARDNSNTALKFAVLNGHTATAKVLLDKGADVNAKDIFGKTALMEAAGKGDTATLQVLLNKGADVNAKDNYDYTALILAAAERHTDTVKILLDKGADVNVISNNGTALWWAQRNFHTELIQMLRKAGATR